MNLSKQPQVLLYVSAHYTFTLLNITHTIQTCLLLSIHNCIFMDIFCMIVFTVKWKKVFLLKCYSWMVSTHRGIVVVDMYKSYAFKQPGCILDIFFNMA